LLARVGVSTTVRPLLGTTLAGVALSSSIPAGAAASAIYWYRALRAYGADRRQATHVLIVITLVSIASLAALVAAGAGIAEAGAVSASARLTILAGVAVLATALLTRRSVRSAYHLGVAALASANWLLDCLALYAALRAVGADVPFRALVATYAVAQIVAVIPLLPGGGGTVEASLALGFAAFGHTSGSVVAGVVLYRLISNWGLVPIGWAAIAAHQRVHPDLAFDRSGGVGLEPLRQSRVGVGAREQHQPEREEDTGTVRRVEPRGVDEHDLRSGDAGERDATSPQEQAERRAPGDPRAEEPDAPDGPDDRERELRGLRHVSGARC
jgi:hypothetical protein